MRNRVFRVAGVLLLMLSAGALALAQPKGLTPEALPVGTSPLVHDLVKQLFARDPLVRGRAAFKLGSMGETAGVAVPFLAALLDDATPLKWVDAGPTNKPGEAPTSVAELAAGSLSKLGPTGASGLVKVRAHPDPRIRAWGYRGLGWTDRRDLEPLIQGLRDSDVEIRRIAAGNLSLSTDKYVAPALIGVLGDKDTRVQASALSYVERTLRELEVDGLIAGLHAALAGPDVAVRRRAAVCLARLDDPAAVPALIEILGDAQPTPAARKDAVMYLRLLTGADAGNDAKAWEAWWQANGAALLRKSRERQ
jgi:HEAT repeat protein